MNLNILCLSFLMPFILIFAGFNTFFCVPSKVRENKSTEKRM